MKESWNSIDFIHKTFCSVFFFNFIITDLFASPSKHLCLLEQRDALIMFKNELKINKYCYSKTETWTNSSDCCTWDGITCHANFGYVTELNLSQSCLTGQLNSKTNLFRLQNLCLLDLSYNNFNSQIPSTLANLSKLTTLSLSGNHFSGRIPSTLTSLSKLTTLSLCGNNFSGQIPFSLENLSNLVTLDLSRNNFSGQIPFSLANLSKLTTFSLSRNNISGQIPYSLASLSKLTTLDLFANNFSGQITFSLANLSKLTTLDLASNNFGGQIPFSLGNLSHLKILYLRFNNLIGEIPSDFGRLKELVELSLGYNKLSGNFPITLLNLTKLSTLSLGNNQLTGTFPPNMTSLSNLEGFDVLFNAFTGTLPSSIFAIPNIYSIRVNENQLNGTLDFGNSSSTVEYLNLGKNKFRGPIPRSIVKLVNLKNLDLSYLNTNGSVDFSIFSHFKALSSLYLSHLYTTTTFDLNETLSCFKSLQVLDLSGNHVSANIKVSISDHPLVELNLSRCGLTKFPEFLRIPYKMMFFDISNNEIKGQVPGWLWSLPNLDYVDLSSNKFIGFERSMNPRLSSTQEPRMVYLFGANNNFRGNIPSFICGFSSLRILDLSNNKFNGSTPGCFGNFSTSLEVLNLSKNRISGGIPENLSISLVSVDLGHNQLVGKLPRSLVHISSLEVLNVESNKINDTFPFWLSSLQDLEVLVLRSNAFHGPIQKVGFSKLRIIDISGNHFSGTLPSDCFVNWIAMFSLGITEDEDNGEYMGTYSGNGGYYRDSMVLMNKGVETELVRILKIFTAVDFSGNKFEGEIPSSIGLLKALHVLNLSNNAFSGHISSTIADLIELESLDVSQNKLSGEIPQELGKLSFLSYMDFSHNQLVGPIPGSTQFTTQPCSSFEDNPGLFGPTFDRVCGDIHKKTSQQSEMQEKGEDEEEVISWIAAAIGVIPGIFFGFTMGYILLSNKSMLFIKTLGRNRC